MEYIIFASIILLITVLLYCWIRIQIKLSKAHLAEQERKKHLALSLHPAYQKKVADERVYELERERLELARQKQIADIDLAHREFTLKQHVTMTRVPPETYLLDYKPVHITVLPSLKRAPEEKEKRFDHLLESPRQPPTEEYLLSQIKENSFTVSPGIQASNGQPVFINITQVPHGKLIGSSGFGKSTCMYIMLRQAVETNHPRRLQVALLDLEHKTSRLLEDYPHVATLRIGKRLVQMVATNADQVAEYLGYLKLELDRRALLSEAELYRQPALLIYVEEMLSLQYEVLDPRLLQIIFHSLTILSVRGKKYGMFLYACMQTDYSTEELKVSQKMFRFRGAASVDPTAARAAGFYNTDLVKHNFQNGQPGQIVIEYPSFSDLVIVPAVELKQLIAKKSGVSEVFSEVSDPETEEFIPDLKTSRNTTETDLKTVKTARRAHFQEIKELQQKHWGKVKIIEKVYHVKAGASKAYKQAEKEYEEITRTLSQDGNIQQERIEA